MDLVTQQRISGSIWGSTIGRSKWLQNDRIPIGRNAKKLTYLGWNIVLKMPGVLRMVEFGTKWRRVAMDIGPVDLKEERMSLHNCVKRIRNLERSPRTRLTLIKAAPSSLRVAPESLVKALCLACTIIELGRATELGVCEPKRFSGSQSNCSIRSTASCDMCGSAGKRKDCFQFKIFCRVTCR